MMGCSYKDRYERIVAKGHVPLYCSEVGVMHIYCSAIPKSNSKREEEVLNLNCKL